MSAERCPVCGGSGKYFDPPSLTSVTVPEEGRTCHGCGGKGWVETYSSSPYLPIYRDPCAGCPYKPWAITYYGNTCEGKLR